MLATFSQKSTHEKFPQMKVFCEAEGNSTAISHNTGISRRVWKDMAIENEFSNVRKGRDAVKKFAEEECPRDLQGAWKKFTKLERILR